MEHLTKTQLVFLVLLVSFVVSAVTGIVTAALMDQAPSPLTDTIHKVVERVNVVSGEKNTQEQTEKITIITQEDLIIKLVKDTAPSVVSVVASKDVPVVEQYFSDPFFNDPFFQQFFPQEFREQFRVPEYRQRGTERREIGSGTGFFVSSDGFIVTNRHVVEDTDASYTIIMNDGRKLDVKVLARDPIQDIAILKSDGANFPFLPLGNSDDLQAGQTVIAIGNALGEFRNTVSVGVISGLGRSIVAAGALSGPEELRGVIQTDAAINPGNSGGPLFDLSGKVIGINTAMAKDAQSIGFALPINLVKKAINDVKASGRITYGFLGVRYISINPQVAKERNLAVDYGVLLVKGPKGESVVVDGSPAQKAGLKEGDIILEINGMRITPEKQLVDIISQKSIGEKITLKILRDGKEIIVDTILAGRPDSL